MAETAGGVGAVEEAMQAAEKHEARSEKLAALVAEARELIEQARAIEVERARLAAEAAAAAAAVKAAEEVEAAAELQQLDEEMAALGTRRQQVQAKLGSSSVAPPAAPAPHLDAEETLCVVCMDAPKDHLVLPCKHLRV
jgi:seryl-tRNA synthetase